MRGSAVAGVLAFVGFVTAGLLGAIAYMQYDKFRKEKLQMQEKSRKQEDALKTENQTLALKVDDLKQRLMQANVTISKLKGEKDVLQKQLETQKQIVESLRKREKRFQDSEAELRATKTELDLLKKQLSEKEQRLAVLQKRVDNQEKELSALRKTVQEYRLLRKQADELSGLLAQKKAEAAMLRRRIRWLEGELSKAQAGQSDTIQEMRKQLEEQRKAAESLSQKCSKLAEERDSLKEQLEEVVGRLAAKKKAEAKLARKFMEELQVLGAARGSFGTFWLRCSNGTTPGTLISLSQVLDLDPNTAGVHAELRAMGRFGFSFDFFQTSYSVSTMMTEDAQFRSITLQSGHDVKGRFRGRWGTVALHLGFGSLFRSGYRRFDVGVSAGVRIADYYAWLRDVTDSEEDNASLTTVCPFGGVWFRYYFATDICFTARAASGAFNYGDYNSPYFFEGAALVNIKLASILSFEAGYIFTVHKFRYEDSDTGEYSRFEQTSGGPYLGLLLVF